MDALKIIQKVPDDGILILQLPQHIGKKLEIIILSSSNDMVSSPFSHMELQQKSGFVMNILKSQIEDVWNDI